MIETQLKSCGYLQPPISARRVYRLKDRVYRQPEEVKGRKTAQYKYGFTVRITRGSPEPYSFVMLRTLHTFHTLHTKKSLHFHEFA